MRISIWEKLSTELIWSKVNYLISNFSPQALTKLRPSDDATFSTLLRFWIFDRNKRKKTKKSQVWMLKDFVPKHLFTYFQLEAILLPSVRPVLVGIFLPYTTFFSVGTDRTLRLWVIGRELIAWILKTII